jgi:2-dehydro-3-deoxygluconokinase
MQLQKITCIGECMLEIASIGGGLLRTGVAGDTFNTAWYARATAPKTGLSVDYFTVVGDDEMSSNMLAFMLENGIGTSNIHKLPKKTVGCYLISLQNAERSFTYWRDTSAARTLADDPDYLLQSLQKSDLIYFSGITLAILNKQKRDDFLKVLKILKSKGVTIALDSNIRPRLWPSLAEMQTAIVQAYQISTIALPTFSDEQAIFGHANTRDLGEAILDFSIGTCVIKSGEHSTMVMTAKDSTLVPTVRVNHPVDTTGAGDSFNGAYLAAHLLGLDPIPAARFAHKIAARVICNHGALVDMTTFADLVLSEPPESHLRLNVDQT